MGMQASIDINFAKEYSPKEILKNLIYSGWEFDYQGSVSYLLPSDIDDYDWQFIDKNDFDIEEFISSHYDKDKIGIVMIIDRISGGNMLIYPDYLSLSLSINRHYLSESETIPDFNWYLKRLNIGMSTLFHTTKLRGNCLLNAIGVKKPNDECSRLLLYQYA